MAKKRVNFKFAPMEDFQTVKVCGSFTDWENDAIVLKKNKSGAWSKMVFLEPGEYQYKFLADGRWLIDPLAANRVADGLGGENSIRLVR
jgi:1,4-alpha-glucan branching enzyme